MGVCNQLRHKLACSSTETSWGLEISAISSRGIILSRQRTTKTLIRLRGCAGWSAPLLFDYGINRFSQDAAQVFFINYNVSPILLKFPEKKIVSLPAFQKIKKKILKQILYCSLIPYTVTIIGTASSEFGTYRLCEQRRFRRACSSAQSRQNLRCSLIQALSQEEPSDRKPDPWPF